MKNSTTKITFFMKDGLFTFQNISIKIQRQLVKHPSSALHFMATKHGSPLRVGKDLKPSRCDATDGC